MTPLIDYTMLGMVVTKYKYFGYQYVEVPWVVSKKEIRATLPREFGYFEQMIEENVKSESSCACASSPSYSSRGGLVGSAEQGFLALDLPAGMYVGVSPCFRDERNIDMLTRPYFMKVELFSPGAQCVDVMVRHASAVMSGLLDDGMIIHQKETQDGIDLMLGDIEIGSYGTRETSAHGVWSYGTGLALPRFSVARAYATVV